MRKYAIVIRKFQRRLNIAISDFLDIGVYGFEEDFENKEEDDDSRLAVYDPWSRERTKDSREEAMKMMTTKTKTMITSTYHREVSD